MDHGRLGTFVALVLAMVALAVRRLHRIAEQLGQFALIALLAALASGRSRLHRPVELDGRICRRPR